MNYCELNDVMQLKVKYLQL